MPLLDLFDLVAELHVLSDTLFDVDHGVTFRGYLSLWRHSLVDSKRHFAYEALLLQPRHGVRVAIRLVTERLERNLEIIDVSIAQRRRVDGFQDKSLALRHLLVRRSKFFSGAGNPRQRESTLQPVIDLQLGRRVMLPDNPVGIAVASEILQVLVIDDGNDVVRRLGHVGYLCGFASVSASKRASN